MQTVLLLLGVWEVSICILSKFSESATQRLKALIQKVLPNSKWKFSKINIELCRSCV